MRDVFADLLRVWHAGKPFALATVVSVSGSAPRQPGTAMVVTGDGEVIGSVSGGCVEAAVYDQARELVTGGSARLVSYGVSDSDAFSVGLTCGGTITIFIQRVDPAATPWVEEVARAVADGSGVAVATVIADDDPSLVGRTVVCGARATDGQTLGAARLDRMVRKDVAGCIAMGRSAVVEYGSNHERVGNGSRVFINTFAPPPRLLVFGAVDFAAALAQAGSFLGYRVTVCDARATFTTTDRFPFADDVVVEWPHRYLEQEADSGRIDARTAVCVLTHDAKFDVPVLGVALRLPEVGYVGAMGSRRTHYDRLARLREHGMSDKELAALHSPLGLDIGAATPQETAVSIVAEIIAERTGRNGIRLGTAQGAIHPKKRAARHSAAVQSL